MASKMLCSSISYQDYPAATILALLSLDNIATETKTENMKHLKTNLDSIRRTIADDLQAFQALVNHHIPQLENTANPKLETLKFQAIVQTFEYGYIESSLFNELVTEKLIENNQFISSPDIFNMIPTEEHKDGSTIFRVRTVCYHTFVNNLQLLNRYTHELKSGLDHLEKNEINENTRPRLITLLQTLGMSKEGDPILNKFINIFDKYSGIKIGTLAPYIKKRDEIKQQLMGLNNHTLQRGRDIIHRCTKGVALLATVSAAIDKAYRYVAPSPKELDQLSSHEPYVEELKFLSKSPQHTRINSPKIHQTIEPTNELEQAGESLQSQFPDKRAESPKMEPSSESEPPAASTTSSGPTPAIDAQNTLAPPQEFQANEPTTTASATTELIAAAQGATSSGSKSGKKRK
ncbi:MAG: hypothetical protein WCG10_00015 [Chlamydiota bacterium]